MGKIVSACVDVVFKKLFTDKENRNILRSFLSDILNIPYDDISEITVENSEITPEEIEQKFTRFDVKLTVDSKLINIEMQMYNYGDFRERSLYYWAQNYGSQLKKGESYRNINSTISINILNFTLFKHNDYRSFYTMADIEHNEILTDKCAMYFFELTKLNKSSETDDNINRWMRIIKADREEDLDMLTTNTESSFNDCIMVIKRYNADERMREMARRREDSLRIEAGALEYAESKGKAEGKAEERKNMIKMMKLSGLSEEQINAVLAQQNNI